MSFVYSEVRQDIRMNVILTSVILLGVIMNYALAARVLLVFLHAGYSHHVTYLPYMQMLADRGHDLYVISNFPVSHPHITFINVGDKEPYQSSFSGRSSVTGFSNMLQSVFAMYKMSMSVESNLSSQLSNSFSTTKTPHLTWSLRSTSTTMCRWALRLSTALRWCCLAAVPCCRGPCRYSVNRSTPRTNRLHRLDYRSTCTSPSGRLTYYQFT